MGKLIRKQIYITLEQNAFLKRRARELGVTQAALIRRAIEALPAGGSEPDPRTRAEAWVEALAFMEERAKLVAPASTAGRGWTREELYDGRPKRWAG